MSKHVIYRWKAAGLIKEDKWEEVKVMSKVQAGYSDWCQFVVLFLMIAGVMSLALGVIFFFAFNWDGMSRFVKFGLIQGALLLSLLMYWRMTGKDLVQQALLLMMALLIGAWLALVGQTYQTGADPWELFAIWSVMIVPLVLISRFEAMWMLLWVLLNLSLSLYQEVNSSLFGLLFNQQAWLFSFVALNAAFLMWFEYLAKVNAVPHWLNLKYRWSAQVVAFALLWLVLIVGFAALFDQSMNRPLSVLVFLLTAGGFFIYYRHVLFDVALLAFWCLMMVVMVTALLAKILFKSFDDFGVLLVIGMAVIGMSVMAGRWLMGLRSGREASVHQPSGGQS